MPASAEWSSKRDETLFIIFPVRTSGVSFPLFNGVHAVGLPLIKKFNTIDFSINSAHFSIASGIGLPSNEGSVPVTLILTTLKCRLICC